MYIEKAEIIADLRARGLNERADWVDRDLPPLVDTQKHPALQPIEVAALADAYVTAADATGDARWLAALGQAAGWFLGQNDAGAAMWDVQTGGCYDGLTSQGPNRNQGAESTLALISTLQHARRLTQR